VNDESARLFACALSLTAASSAHQGSSNSSGISSAGSYSHAGEKLIEAFHVLPGQGFDILRVRAHLLCKECQERVEDRVGLRRRVLDTRSNAESPRSNHVRLDIATFELRVRSKERTFEAKSSTVARLGGAAAVRHVDPP
jgi:hypothetical protein